MLGNRWILGFTKIKPSWATEFFPDEIEVVRDEIVVTGKYPDADEDVTYPTWTGPKTGWKLSNGECVERFTDEDKDDYKQRAVDAEATLHL
jgi:hypothetical protein